MPIPESIPPNQAVDGVVFVVYDLHDTEVTRSVVTPGNVERIELQAIDGAEAQIDAGGGRVVAFDGDTGEQLFVGPQRRPGEPLIVAESEINLLRPTFPAKWPWGVVGVFATPDQHDPEAPHGAWWEHYCYTVGFYSTFELWAPVASIEGRVAGHDLTGACLNLIAMGFQRGLIMPGDTVRIPLGCVEDDEIVDRDSYWWIGDPVIDLETRYQTHQSRAPGVIPIRWSSPLGWGDD